MSGMRTLIFAVTVLFIGGCSKTPNDMTEFYRMYGSDSADVGDYLSEVSKMNVFFGHQSVGNNILAGIAQWEEKEGVSLNIIETKDFSAIGNGTFVQFRVGSNGNPQSKVDEFVSLAGGISQETPSIAFFKFCYVDVVESSDVDQIFDYFKGKMVDLKKQQPNTRFILFTVPLTTVQTGWKATAKKVLSIEPAGVLDNVRRSEFNERILSELSGDFPVFDLSAIESTLPDGTTSTFSREGTEYPCLAEVYASDMGHLNEFGSEIAAYNLLAFLAEELK
jgi:hypothetical protein